MNKKTISMRIVGYDEAKIKAAIRKAFLDAEFSYVEKMGDIEVSCDVHGFVIKPANDSSKMQGSILSETIVSVMKERCSEMQISNDSYDPMYCANTGVIDFPQMNCTATCAFFHRDARKDVGRKELDVEGYERRTSRSVFNFEDNVDVKNNIKKRKEHDGLPDSSVSMNKAAVPPDDKRCQDFQEMLLDLEWDDRGDPCGVATLKYHQRRAIHKGERMVHRINGLRVLYDSGVFTVIQREGGPISLPIPKKDMDFNIMAAILAESQEDPECRVIIEKINGCGYTNYSELVKYLLNGTYKIFKDRFDETELEYLDEFKEKVIGFRKYIEVKD